MSFNRDIFAANLRGLRNARKLTQKEAGDAIGVSDSKLSELENSKGSISYEDAWKLADFYGVGIDELGGRDMSRRCITVKEVA